MSDRTLIPPENERTKLDGCTPRCCKCASNPCRTCRCVKLGRRCTTCRFGDDCPNSLPKITQTCDTDIATEIANLKQVSRVLPLIPKGARIAVADELAHRINDAVDLGTKEAWRKLLCFAYSALNIDREARQTKKASLATKVKLNLVQNNGTNKVHPSNPAKHSNGHRPVDEMAALSRRVASKINDGDIRGALRALTSDDSFAPPTDEVIKKMQEKHPESPTDLRNIPPPDDTHVPLVASEAEILKAINSFPPSSSAGLDGIRPAHLRSLLTKHTAEAGARLLTALTALTNLALSGRLPECATPAFFGASLISLRKKDGGLRPIAVGSVYRRIAGKVAATAVSAAIGAQLRPVQLGVATRNGCEAAVHATRGYIEQCEISMTKWINDSKQ